MNEKDPIETREDAAEQVPPADTSPQAEPRSYVTDKPPKKPKQVPLAAAIASVAVVCVLAVLLTFSLTTRYLNRQPDAVITNGQGEADKSPYSEIDLIDKLFRSLTIRELNDDALLEGVLHGYVDATGDRYAEYYNAQELADLQADQNGEMCGIGITVVSQTFEYKGQQHNVIQLTDVYDDSPAKEAGLLPGDRIIRVGTGDDEAWVTDIGYDKAVDRIRGEEGTEAFFTVVRETGNGAYTEIPMKAVRRKMTVLTVKYHVYDQNRSVGVIRISQFNNTTAPQFADAVDALKAQGCTDFVLDLRGNPGGLLTAVEDLVTFFLDPGDVILYSRNNKGEKTTYDVKVEDGVVTSGSRTQKAEDVGRFKGLHMTVLVNGDTASAAELFTANVQHYKLGKVVGTQTYGKGTMQTTYSLSSYGYPGALKLTTQYYDGPSGQNYDGVGLTPDETVELTDEAAEYILVLLPEDKDNQLQKAVQLLGR
ncbi:MAG: S41 family peptidase [Clostridia bacterium]|nr:S41 family peptidase [Clostridia bacterium]